MNGQLKNKYGDAFIRGNNVPSLPCTLDPKPLSPSSVRVLGREKRGEGRRAVWALRTTGANMAVPFSRK